MPLSTPHLLTSGSEIPTHYVAWWLSLAHIYQIHKQRPNDNKWKGHFFDTRAGVFQTCHHNTCSNYCSNELNSLVFSLMGCHTQFLNTVICRRNGVLDRKFVQSTRSFLYVALTSSLLRIDSSRCLSSVLLVIIIKHDGHT